jgi:hypothetical protein
MIPESWPKTASHPFDLTHKIAWMMRWGETASGSRSLLSWCGMIYFRFRARGQRCALEAA